MDRHNRLSSRGDGRLNEIQIDIVVIPDIHQDWRSACMVNRRDRCYKRVRNRNDFMIGTDTGSPER